MNEGVAQAWQELAGLDPVDVCRRSGAEYDADSARYRLAFYRQEVTICPAELTISGGTEIAKNLVERLGYFSGLSLLNYLVHARTPEASGRWIAPADNWTSDDIVENKCPSCGQRLEFWKDDVRRKCTACGKPCFNPNIGNTCLAWCASAADCLGNRDIETWKKEHGFTDDEPAGEADGDDPSAT